MKGSYQAGRNEPCPCGSGRKFKLCCQPKQLQQAARRSPAVYAVIGIAVVILAIVVGKAAFGPKAPPVDTAATTNSAPLQLPLSAGGLPQPTQSGGVPQPPGPVPEGKVWSPEHGHWHDVPASPVVTTAANVPGVNITTNFTPAPAPTGAPPAGMVWSTEHGHWHAAPKEPNLTVNATPATNSPTASTNQAAATTDAAPAQPTPKEPAKTETTTELATPQPAPAEPAAPTPAPTEPTTPQP